MDVSQSTRLQGSEGIADLELPAAKDTVVKHERLGDEIRFREFHVRVPAKYH